MSGASDIRRRELAQIHIAKAQLGLDDETYRAMLWAVARVKSAADLDWTGRKNVLDHLAKSGWSPSKRSAGRPAKWRQGCEALGGKIEALLAAQGLPWRYLTHGKAGRPSMLKRLAGVDRLEFADSAGLTAIVAALVKRGKA